LIIKQTSPGSIEELAYALRKIRFAPGAMAPVVYVLFNFTMVNVALGVFNLIPIPPLDGSGIVISLFGGSVARVYASFARYGFLILIALLYLGVLSWIFNPIFRFLLTIIGL
jgi:Zn-dependent protease